jgi:hypothetical protein
MSSSRSDRIDQIFHEAVELPEDQRGRFLEKACGGDEELLEEVKTLLAETDSEDQFLETPALQVSAEQLSEMPATKFSLAPRFVILGEIGTGGMGVVYQARDTETGAVLAVKVLHSMGGESALAVGLLKSELLLARKIAHKNVCRVHDLIRVGDVVAISMEYVEGESLRALLDRPQGLSVSYGLGIVRQICSGLAEAHAQGVIHRDLKPENILIARDGTVKLMDFGIARGLDPAKSLTGDIKGTPAYMSPEQADAKSVDARSDIYSLGLVMYEIFCGQRLFTADSPVALAMKHVHEEPAPPELIAPHVPAVIHRVISKCLEKNPGKRFQSVAQLETALSGPQDVFAENTSVITALPAHLAHWQRSDWLLLAVAILSVLLFFTMFERTSFAPLMQIPAAPAVFEKMAQDHVRDLGASLPPGSRVSMVPLPDQYDYVVTRGGASAAMDLANTPVPYFVFHVQGSNGTSIDLNTRGQIVNFAREFAPDSAIESISAEDPMTLAAKAVREFLGVDPSLLILESSGAGLWRGHTASSFTWLDPTEYHGLRRRLVVQLVGKDVASLESKFTVPGGTVRTITRLQLIGLLAVPVLMLFAGFSRGALASPHSRWRIILTIAASVMTGRLAWLVMESMNVPTIMKVSSAVNATLAFALLMPFILIALERAVRRTGAHRLETTIRMLGRRVSTEPVGLAILRGTFIGLILVSVDIVLVWLATKYLGMWLDSTMLNFTRYYHDLSWRVAQNALITIGVLPCLAAYFAWIASLVATFARRSWHAIIIAALVLVAIFPRFVLVSMLGFLEPYPAKLLVVFVAYLIVAWTFYRFDYLTILVALFTCVFCSRNYFFLVMVGPSGSNDERVGFVLFGLFVAAAAAVAFKSRISSTYRRVIEAF